MGNNRRESLIEKMKEQQEDFNKRLHLSNTFPLQLLHTRTGNVLDYDRETKNYQHKAYTSGGTYTEIISLQHYVNDPKSKLYYTPITKEDGKQ